MIHTALVVTNYIHLFNACHCLKILESFSEFVIMSNGQTEEKIVDGYIRKQHIQIPTEIITIIFQFYHLQYELLKFDPQYKSEPVKISVDGMCFSWW